MSLALNVYLAGTLYLGIGRVRPSRPGFQKGEMLGKLVVHDRMGQRQELAFAENKQTVMYVLRPTCGWCKRNSRAVKELYTRVSSEYGFVALSLEENGLQEFLAESGIPFAAYALAPESASLRTRFTAVPQTLVLARGGRIAEIWTGAYGGETKTAIERFFGTSLPSLE